MCGYGCACRMRVRDMSLCAIKWVREWGSEWVMKEERGERIVDLKQSVGYLLHVTDTHCLTLMAAIPISKFSLLIAHKMPTLQCRRRCCATTPPCPCSGDINRHPGTYVCVRLICGELIQIVNTNSVWIFLTVYFDFVEIEKPQTRYYVLIPSLFPVFPPLSLQPSCSSFSFHLLFPSLFTPPLLYSFSCLLISHPHHSFPPHREQFLPLMSAAEAIGVRLDITSSKTLADTLDLAVKPEGALRHPRYSNPVTLLHSPCLREFLFSTPMLCNLLLFFPFLLSSLLLCLRIIPIPLCFIPWNFLLTFFFFSTFLLLHYFLQQIHTSTSCYASCPLGAWCPLSTSAPEK